MNTTTTPPSQHQPPPGLRHLDEAVKKVLYFSEHNTPPARRAHPADRVTDNRQQFHRRYYRIGEATNFTEAQQ